VERSLAGAGVSARRIGDVQSRTGAVSIAIGV
jgi:hypothetical protein